MKNLKLIFEWNCDENRELWREFCDLGANSRISKFFLNQAFWQGYVLEEGHRIAHLGNNKKNRKQKFFSEKIIKIYMIKLGLPLGDQNWRNNKLIKLLIECDLAQNVWADKNTINYNKNVSKLIHKTCSGRFFCSNRCRPEPAVAVLELRYLWSHSNPCCYLESRSMFCAVAIEFLLFFLLIRAWNDDERRRVDVCWWIRDE